MGERGKGATKIFKVEGVVFSKRSCTAYWLVTR